MYAYMALILDNLELTVEEDFCKSMKENQSGERRLHVLTFTI